MDTVLIVTTVLDLKGNTVLSNMAGASGLKSLFFSVEVKFMISQYVEH